jgi:glycerophosphoryl diester phosphodiesterase
VTVGAAILAFMNVVGHRGASADQPENTPPAFAKADEMGADGVELDVRIAPDGRGLERLVVFHNPLSPEQSRLDELPSFDDVLDACGSRMLINVEIKNSADDGGFDASMAVVAPTIAAMRRRGAKWADRWLISSFSLATIEHCRLVAPEIPTAYLVLQVTSETIAAAVDGGHIALHPWEKALNEDHVGACHAAGLIVNVWTCNDAERLVELHRMGVDGVCTDVPDVALTALGRSESAPTPTPTWGRPA